MKSAGLTRKVDNLGRLAIPVELMKNLKLKPYDYLNSYIEDEYIILSKTMARTRIKRKIDGLGRYVIPRGFLKKFNCENQSLEIYLENDDIYLKPYAVGCIFCGEVRDTINFNNKCICESCLKDLKDLSR